MAKPSAMSLELLSPFLNQHDFSLLPAYEASLASVMVMGFPSASSTSFDSVSQVFTAHAVYSGSLTCDSERPVRLKSILCADAVSAETKAIENNTCLFMFYLKFESCFISFLLILRD